MLPTTQTRRHRLSNAARRFCDDFAQKKMIVTLLTHFSNTHPCEVIEHGLSKFAPFLGSPFRGREGVRLYFSTVAASITYEDMHFSEYVIDGEVGKVSVKGTATFTWISTRESWDETFAYVLDFDDQDKITRYQIWGDTGALYLASQGRLREVSGSDGTSFQRLLTPLSQVGDLFSINR
ncbi:hypothetical protein J3R83DRAFT_8451 [Lanmaoa asiatica]|nr:hypothetical protein J3R83DRAFT_8451 [Lanmaoa asiatica]